MLIRRKALAGVVSLVVVLGACGKDNKTGSSPTSPSSSVAAASAVETTTATTGSGGTTPGPEGPPEVNPCAPGESGELGPPTPPSADAKPLVVIAKDFSFTGLEKVTKGDYALTLKNEGEELHEITVVRLNDDEKRTAEELFKVNEDPATFSTDVASQFACPGTTSKPTQFNIQQPGRYVAACFVPTGTTPKTSPSEFQTLGPPHALKGMAFEFTVKA